MKRKERIKLAGKVWNTNDRKLVLEILKKTAAQEVHGYPYSCEFCLHTIDFINCIDRYESKIDCSKCILPDVLMKNGDNKSEKMEDGRCILILLRNVQALKKDAETLCDVNSFIKSPSYAANVNTWLKGIIRKIENDRT